MLHSTLSALLVSVASRYAELSPADVGIGIGGGRLVIDDVKLRAETFNSPSLPFHVYQGRAGRLRVNVPWSALSSSPVEVYLENIHLIAGPKQNMSSHVEDDTESVQSTMSKKDGVKKSRQERRKGPWHQTSVGRLAFNVSVEMYGLKVEYRDDSCVGIMSVASVRAYSADHDWKNSFVSLALDSDDDIEDMTTAVAMRKVVRLSGVHWVMIPRSAEKDQDPSKESRPDLDLDSFESKAPIVDGIAITLRVLLCTGKARIEPNIQALTPGLHSEIEIDLEEPKVNLTARQMKWIDHILKQGLGVSAEARDEREVPYLENGGHLSPYTKRRPRSVSSSSLPKQPASQTNGDSSQAAKSQERATSTAGQSPATALGAHVSSLENQAPSINSNGKLDYDDRFGDEAIDAEIQKVSQYDDDLPYSDEDDDVLSNQAGEEASLGGFSSFWQAIVGENGDETIDDAAIALGLSSTSKTQHAESEKSDGDETESSERTYALKAVEAAAKAGGLTVQVRLKTPDVKAWDLVERLRGEARRDQLVIGKLRDAEAILEAAESRVRSSEAEIQSLRERNDALLKELQDLERMTSQAGRNKDAMIRQMEAALTKAERNLQAMMQTQLQSPRSESTVLSASSVIKVTSPTFRGTEHNLLSSNTAPLDDGEGREDVEEVAVDVTASADGDVDDAVKLEEAVSEKVELATSVSEPVTPQRDARSSDPEGNNFELTSTTSAPFIAPSPDMHQESSTPHLPVGMNQTFMESRTDEQYLRSLSSQKLEEAMSSEGLTLI